MEEDQLDKLKQELAKFKRANKLQKRKLGGNGILPLCVWSVPC